MIYIFIFLWFVVCPVITIYIIEVIVEENEEIEVKVDDILPLLMLSIFGLIALLFALLYCFSIYVEREKNNVLFKIKIKGKEKND